MQLEDCACNRFHIVIGGPTNFGTDQTADRILALFTTQHRACPSIPSSYRYQLHQLQFTKQTGAHQWDDGLSLCQMCVLNCFTASMCDLTKHFFFYNILLGIPCVTDCVLAELEKLGHRYRIALRVARDPRFERLTCSHQGTYADDCLVQRVTASRCYIVATCDRELRRRIRKIPGVPLMYIVRRRYAIERLPDQGAPS